MIVSNFETGSVVRTYKQSIQQVCKRKTLFVLNESKIRRTREISSAWE